MPSNLQTVESLYNHKMTTIYMKKLYFYFINESFKMILQLHFKIG